MAAVASNPSISGICTSIRITSNGVVPGTPLDCFSQQDGLAAVVGDRDRMPPPLEQLHGHLLVH